jgi:SAM-dependent MidA family methyltransferase
MRFCLHDPSDGYYATRPALGGDGDFITAPQVSQMFGECLGIWTFHAWLELGRPSPFSLVEAGPGLGVMMSDALRAARRLDPDFIAAARLWLVETSGPLRQSQAATTSDILTPSWVDGLQMIPKAGPVILLANEFLDCLPIRQAVRTPTGWRERCVGLEDGGRLAFVVGARTAPPSPVMDAPFGGVVEWSPDQTRFGAAFGAMIADRGGAGLFVDYGHAAPTWGDTLQAVRRHRKESPLANPGEADLSARVDFAAFARAAVQGGALVTPARSQGALLADLGLRERAGVLGRSRPDRAEVIARQCHRLIGADQMGELFKAIVVHSPGWRPLGFGEAA